MPNHRTRAVTGVSLVSLLLAAASVAGLAPGPSASATPAPDPQAGASPTDVVEVPDLDADVADRGTTRAIITFTSPDAAADVLADAEVTGGEVFPAAASAAAKVDRASLDALRADPRVAAVAPDFEMQPLLNETIPFVRADVAWSRGDTGAGRYVAVLDSGISAHPMFRGDIAYEACFTVNASCTGHKKAAIGPGAAQECRLFECAHGLHVAGIAAGNAVAGRVPGGVGRGAGIIAIRVFRVVDRDGAVGISASSSDLLRALEHVNSLAAAPRFRGRIAAVNLSLGFIVDNRGFSVPCNGDNRVDGLRPVLKSLARVFSKLRAKGIAVVAASGNEFLRRGIAAPACLDHVISVGSVDLGDQVSAFSNTARGLAILAPGETATCRNGECGIKSAAPRRWGDWTRTVGTSVAAPHVAGAYAILREITPARPLEDLHTAMRRSGVPVRDARTGQVTPRLDVPRAADALRQFTREVVDQPDVRQPHVGDFNGDGADDIFWYDPTGLADGVIWVGGPDHTFTPATSVVAPAANARITVGDLDGDGFDDIWATLPDPGESTPWVDIATFGSAGLSALTGVSYPHIGRVLATGDFLGDDSDDLYVQDAGDGHDTIMEIAADRGSTIGTPSSQSSASSIPTLVGDLDANGADDLVRPADQQIWFSKGTGTFIVKTGLPISTKTVVADIDGNGRDDVVSVGSDTDVEVWYSGLRRTHTPVFFYEPQAFSVFSGDFDGDAAGDVFFFRPGTDVDDQWYGATDRTHWQMHRDVNAVAFPVVGDFDGDGNDDVLWYGIGAADDAVTFGIGLDD